MKEYDGFKVNSKGEVPAKKSKSSGGGKTAIKKVDYGDQYTKVNGKKSLKPNVEYKSKEDIIIRQIIGRINSAEGTLKLDKVKEIVMPKGW
ncbi:hypothetical protein ACFQ4N_15890 [Oceanobacillus iheyensis]|uniref:hypothetical protein n=1 Tax=Oceanobacillus iheyensis TaxID=182710 RepID=UPI00364473F0